MQAKEITRTVECPSCKWQIIVGLTSDFNGRIRLYCTRCKAIVLDWSAVPKSLSVPQEVAAVSPDNIATITPAQAAMQENLAMSSGFIPSVPKNSDTNHRPAGTEPSDIVSMPDNQEDAGRVGEYKLLKKIGQGAMGVIYVGEHIDKPGTKVAIKLLNQESQKDNHAVERFLQEAKVHSRLVHPNIVRIYDVGYCAETERLYLVMEFVEGESLEAILTTRGAISPKHSLKIAIAVGHALEHALEQRIIHRDLKPANIMIDRRTRKVKVADLGLGKIAEEKGATLSGQMMGTPYYMPPEQIRNAKDVDHRADIYALGATLYHMLTGRPPYAEYKGTLAIVRAKIYRDPIPISEYVQNIPEPLIKIVDKAMSRNIEDRYSVPTQMIDDMQKLLGSSEA